MKSDMLYSSMQKLVLALECTTFLKVLEVTDLYYLCQIVLLRVVASPLKLRTGFK